MRIIAGSAKRREIKVPKTVVRPTTDRTREAIFSMINAYVSGARVLDLFAGAGSLGMEALSRGAQSCTFVDVDRVCAKVVEENLAHLKLVGGEVVNVDVFCFLKGARGKHDLVFADPPYFKVTGDRDFASELLADSALSELLDMNGLFVLEVDAGHKPKIGAEWELVDQRKYGGCMVLFLRKGGAGT